MGKFGEFFERLKRRREDVGLAEDELKLIFKRAVKRNEIRIFTISFLEVYNKHRKILIDLNKKFTSEHEGSEKDKLSGWITENTLQRIDNSRVLIERIKPTFTNEQIAQDLGNALAEFIVAIEYGFVSDGFRRNRHDMIFTYVEGTAKALKKINKSVPNKFIINRLKKIANRYYSAIDNPKVVLLVKMAKLFG